jgi:hypothetical protein
MMLDTVVDNNGSSGGAFQRARPGFGVQILEVRAVHQPDDGPPTRWIFSIPERRHPSVRSRERMITTDRCFFSGSVTLGVGLNAVRPEDRQAIDVDPVGMEQVDIAASASASSGSAPLGNGPTAHWLAVRYEATIHIIPMTEWLRSLAHTRVRVRALTMHSYSMLWPRDLAPPWRCRRRPA